MTEDVRVGIMHVTGGLELGGLERVAVNLVNHLPRSRYELHLCTTRHDGPLGSRVAPDVGRIVLGRRWALDPKAAWKLASYVRDHRIRLLHAHGTALFQTAWSVAMLRPRPVVVWHDHYGRHSTQARSALLHRIALAQVDGIISVTERLADWAVEQVCFPRSRVWYLQNFATPPAPAGGGSPGLPGTDGSRIVCVANLSAKKAQLNLVRAMSDVVRQVREAHLLLVGHENEPEYAMRIRDEIRRLGLEDAVSVLGAREDVADILAGCDIGVLSSDSEGLPIALIEYGMAGLAGVATDVGQCSEVLAGGDAGIVVPPGQPAELAKALIRLLEEEDVRRSSAERLHARAMQVYGPEAGVAKVCEVYDGLLTGRSASSRG